MIGYIITGHGNFATGMASAVKLITGIQDGIIACDFDDMSAFDSVRVKLNEAVATLQGCDNIIIFCDLLSGTPFNQALDLRVSSGDDRIHIIYGVNLPLLIEAVIKGNNEATVDEIMEVLETAKGSIGKVDVQPVDDEEDF